MSRQSYHSVGTLLVQLASGETTPVALVNHYFLHMAWFNKPLDAVVQWHYALVLEATVRANHERLEGCTGGVLHGLSYTVKEPFDVQRWLTTSGAHYLKGDRTTQDTPPITCLHAAGVTLTGKTSVLMMTADWRTYNDLYDTTYNLWDRQRSPGGSSGGAAAAVAVDFTPMEFGSDLFGSLRTPAHYTGVYAHHRNLGLMSVRGYVSGGDSQAIDESDPSAAGPMARGVTDLRLATRALSTFWVEPPRISDFSRCQAKANYRMRIWFNASHHGIDRQIAQRFQLFIDKLCAQPGVGVDDAMLADIGPDALFGIAVKLSGRLVSTALNGRQRPITGLVALGSRLVGKLADVPGGITSYYQDMLEDSGEQRNTDKLRHEYSRAIETLFVCYDVLLIPVNLMLVSTHIQQPVRKRKLTVNDESQDYNEHLLWNMLATVFDLPATVYPLVKTMDGLPCDIQIVSGYFRDDVTINFAEFCESISGGFTVSEGYWRRISMTVSMKVRRI